LRKHTEELARLFKALSDPNRLAILQLIRERCPAGCRLTEEEDRNSVSAIAERFDLALSTVSHHLRELRGAGLIRCEKRGQWVYCAPDEKALARIRSFAGS
jgi:ArsR family transcriptional regulator